MLPYCEGKYERRQNNIDFETARKNLMKEDDKMILKRGFERINNRKVCKSFIKSEDIPQNKQIYTGFKFNKTDKIDDTIRIGCESDVLYENTKLFNFWS